MKKTFNNHFGSPTHFEKQHYIRRYFLFLFKNAEVSNLLFLLQLQSKGGIWTEIQFLKRICKAAVQLVNPILIKKKR